jgi:hypothetical protein
MAEILRGFFFFFFLASSRLIKGRRGAGAAKNLLG